MAAVAVEARGLTKYYGPRRVLDGVDLRLAPGEVVVVEGRSGSGKTTLLQLMAGLDTPDSGAVALGDVRLDQGDRDRRAALRLQRIGLVFQDHRLIPDLTVLENVALPAKLAHRRVSRSHLLSLLDLVGLREHAEAYPDTLSGGEAQRVAIARALVNDPPVVLADEPTASLDEENARRVLALLSRIAEQGKAVMIVSHDPLARQVASRGFRISDGRLAHLANALAA